MGVDQHRRRSYGPRAGGWVVLAVFVFIWFRFLVVSSSLLTGIRALRFYREKTYLSPFLTLVDPRVEFWNFGISVSFRSAFVSAAELTTYKTKQNKQTNKKSGILGTRRGDYLTLTIQ